MTSGPTILIIDDEVEIRRFLRIGLEAQKYSIVDAATGKDGIYQASVRRPVAIILDLGLPDIDGQDVLREIRKWGSMPIIILSVRNDETEKISCFDSGADDYIVKPFALGEFLARLRNALRRQQLPDQPVVVNGNLTVDIPNRIVRIRGTPIPLSPTEYDILFLFVRHMGKVLTHRQIMKEIWGPYHSNESQALRGYIRQLRKKIECDPAHPAILKTVQSVGYRMNLEAESEAGEER